MRISTLRQKFIDFKHKMHDIAVVYYMKYALPVRYFFYYGNRLKYLKYIAIFVSVFYLMDILFYNPPPIYKTELKEVTQIKKTNQKYMYIIDSGHGYESDECGANSANHNGNCFYEWEYCYEVSKILTDKLDKLKILYVRTDDSPHYRNIPIQSRIKLINEVSKRVSPAYEIFLISLHANAAEDKKATGFEVFLNVKKCNKFADKERCLDVHAEIADYLKYQYKTNFPDIPFRTSKKGNSYFESNEANRGRDVGILRQTHCYAILTENGFFTNPIEAKLMRKPEFREKIANIHLNLIKYLEKIDI